MSSPKQCEIARLMTQDTAPDIQINAEIQTIANDKAAQMAQEIDQLCRQHDLPFDTGFPVIKSDFDRIARRYHVSPSTLFCIYMEHQ